MNTISIFTDAATSSKMSIAVGAFLCIDHNLMLDLAPCAFENIYIQLNDLIVYKTYVSKKSTWSEIKIVIDCLNFLYENFKSKPKIQMYTDCQSLCDLLSKRKEKLQANNFITRTGKLLKNADLYKDFFEIANEFQIQCIKVRGHSSMEARISLQEKIFTILDRCSRKKLRHLLSV